MPETVEKDKIFLEIRQTIKYLLIGREKGKENFEISDFFDRNLEDEILNNFDNAISREEYEETILSMFGAKIKKGNITKARVKKEVEKLIKQYRMRSKKQILNKLLTLLQPVPSEMQTLRDYVVENYNKMMQEPLKLKITSFVKEGTTNLRNVMSILRREKYDIEQGEVKKILTKILIEQEKSRSKLIRGKTGRKPSKIKPFSGGASARKKKQDQLKKSLVRKTRYKKQRFIRQECPKFKFELVENKAEGDLRTLIYSGKKGNTVISVKTLLSKDIISDVQILCIKKGNKKPALINIAEFQKSIENDKHDSFMQKWLKSANRQVGFSNVQEFIWFLQSVLNDRFNLPEGVSNYLNKRFVAHLLTLDKNLASYVIEKALESV